MPMQLTAVSGNQSILSATTRTVLQITAPANQRLKVFGFSITVGGTSAIDLRVRVLRQTSAGTSTPVTPMKVDPAMVETIQSTAASTFTGTEPDAGSVLQHKLLQGSYEKIFPMGQEILVPGGTRLAIECLCATAATVAAEFSYEE